MYQTRSQGTVVTSYYPQSGHVLMAKDAIYLSIFHEDHKCHSWSTMFASYDKNQVLEAIVNFISDFRERFWNFCFVRHPMFKMIGYVRGFKSYIFWNWHSNTITNTCRFSHTNFSILMRLLDTQYSTLIIQYQYWCLNMSRLASLRSLLISVAHFVVLMAAFRVLFSFE